MPSKISSFLVVLLAASLGASTGIAAEPAEQCEAKKLKLSGLYAACRLKADAKARLKDTAPDYAKCAERFADNFDDAEGKAGAGVCPSESDSSAIGGLIVESTREAAEQLAGPDPACPPGYLDRHPYYVALDVLAAVDAGDAAAIACNYHEAAYLIDDQGVRVGRTEVVDAMLSLSDLFGGATFEIQDDNVFGDVVRVLWRLDGGWVVIEDGVDTFHIQRGTIRSQTRHGLIEFTGPPPE